MLEHLDYTTARTSDGSWSLSPSSALLIPGERTVAWYRQQLARFTYKPGWTFSIQTPFLTFSIQTPFLTTESVHNTWLYVIFKAEDTYHPGKTVEVGGGKPLYLFGDTEDAFARILGTYLQEMEIHESREWLRRDGEIFDNPHQ